MKPSTQFLNYFPGLVILIFGMLALNASVRLMSAYDEAKARHLKQLENLESTMAVYNDFEENYMQNKSLIRLKPDLNQLTQQIKRLQETDLINAKMKKNEDFKSYRKSIYEIQQTLNILANALNEQNTQNRSDIQTRIEHLSTHMDNVHGLTLRHIINDDFLNETLLVRKTWLYWSVIAIGFAGFILTLLNADKMIQLKRLNEEKRLALNEIESRIAALEMARDGILIVDQNHCTVYVNKALCNITGVAQETRQNLFGQSWELLFSDSDYEVITEDIIPEFQEQGFWYGEFPIYKNDGSVLETEISLTRLPDGGIVGMIQDVSEKQKAKEEKKNLEDQFYQAQKMEAIGRLAGGIAHDFNNILASMNGYAEFLIDDLDKTSEQHQFAQNILQAGLQARKLVDQMLAFSRRSDESAGEVDIVSSIDETLDMLKATLPKTIELKYEKGLDQAYMKGNSTQISQLLMNLCVNAQDAIEGEHGALTLSLQQIMDTDIDIKGMLVKNELPNPEETPFLRTNDVAAGTTQLLLGHIKKETPYIKIHIEDTGCGMSRAIMEHIFEPFFTTKPVDKGTGLGLATVHGVIASHQGFMTIQSTLGKGTAFDLYFPQINNVDENAALSEEKEIQTNQPTDKHILLVEDQEEVRMMMLKMLERLGYQTSSAVTGLEGLEIIQANPKAYDVIITDHNMPKMTGLEMVQQLHEQHPELPFIVVSGYSEKKMQEMIDDHPAIKKVLKKPVAKTVLAKTIQDVLQKVS